jgi:hypothetical protein
MDNNDNDIQALYTGFRPQIDETKSNVRAKKQQKNERDLLLPLAKMIIDHLERECRLNESVLTIKSTTPDKLFHELEARKRYVKKIQELEAWIQSRLSKTS